MTAALPVPSAAEEAGGDWLAAAVADTLPGMRPLGRPPERVGEEYGFASEIWRYRLTDGHTSLAVIVKLWSTDAGDREVHFYRDMAPRSGIRLPRCHHAGVDVAARRAVLVLEDLAPVRQGDVLDAPDADAAAALTDVVSRFHAAWTERPELMAGWLGRPRVRTADWFATRKARFLERFGPPDDPLCRRLFDGIEAAHHVGTGILASSPQTLIHVDLHLDNVVFPQDGDPVLLDWAMAGAGPGALDLASIVFQIGPPDQVTALLERYRAGLAAAGSVPPGSVRLRREVGAAFMLRYATWTLGIARWEPATPRQEAIIAAQLRRLPAAAAAWHDTDPELLDSLGER